jgi:6-phosphogluconolactonase
LVAEIVVLPDADAVAREAARRVVAALAAAVKERHVAHIALTGGSAAPPLYRFLARPENHAAVDWSRVHLWWGDERFVPSDHPDSNAGLAYAQLLGGGQDGAPALPIDPLLAGVGPDGHILSIFPGSPALNDDAPIALAIAAPEHVEPRVARITLSAKSIAEAGTVIVMATGAAKANIVAGVLEGERDVSKWPAQSAVSPNAAWLLDEEAAAQLRSSR